MDGPIINLRDHITLIYYLESDKEDAKIDEHLIVIRYEADSHYLHSFVPVSK